MTAHWRLFLKVTLPLSALNLINQASRTVMAIIGPVLAVELDANRDLRRALFASPAPDEEMQPAADEAACRGNAFQLLLPAPRLGFADRADFRRRMPRASGELRVEAARFTLERHDRLRSYIE